MTKPLRIYIAGPYTAADERGLENNTYAAIDAAIAVFRKGHIPYVPHLTHYVDVRAKQTATPMTWQDYLRWDMPWLELCDAVLYLAPSKGADLEVKRAQELRKTIFDSIDEIPVAGV